MGRAVRTGKVVLAVTALLSGLVAWWWQELRVWQDRNQAIVERIYASPGQELPNAVSARIAAKYREATKFGRATGARVKGSAVQGFLDHGYLVANVTRGAKKFREEWVFHYSRVVDFYSNPEP